MRIITIILFLLTFDEAFAQLSPAPNPNYRTLHPTETFKDYYASEQAVDTFLFPSPIVGVPIGDTMLIANFSLIYPGACGASVTAVNWYVAPPDAQIPFRWLGSDNFNPPHSANVYFFPTTKDTLTQYFRFEDIYDALNHPECPSSKQFVIGVRAFGIKAVKNVSYEDVAKNILLYPNPVTTSFKLYCEVSDDHSELQIFDCLGNPVSNFNFHVENHVIIVDVSKLSKGFYRVMVKGYGRFFENKFIKLENL